MNPLKAEWIEWLDHVGLDDPGWKMVEDTDCLEPWAVNTIGFITKETNDYVIVVNHYDPELGQIGDGMLILKSCILQRRPFQVD